MPASMKQSHAVAPIASAISREVYGLRNLVLERRMATAMNQAVGTMNYPIHREMCFAARVSLEALFDQLALDSRWSAQRLGASSMLIDQDGSFISARGQHKLNYCSCSFEIWAVDVAQARAAQDAILAHVGPALIREPMISIEWNFVTKDSGIESARIEELADQKLLDEAYPYLMEGVSVFIETYLEAEDCVIVVQGPPGTGKTRLIRGILGAMTSRKGRNACAVYTGDTKALETDQIFVNFITGEADAFVIEDADHLLQPRSSGNENLHRFLAIADGVVRAQGRKIIFSTNLPNVGDLDDALVRPGRCFSRVETRKLTVSEAVALVEAVGRREPAKRTLCAAAKVTLERGSTSMSLAEIFKLLRTARQ